jgi:uncharacterized protein YraI
LICLFLLVLTGISVTFAQGDATPIAIGENAIGMVSAEAMSIRYAVTAGGGETAAIQVLSLSGGLIPRFQVYNPDGIAIVDQGNVSGAMTLANTVSFTAPGVYVIAIQGENGTTGQFVLSLQAGTPLPAVELTRSQPVSTIVGSSTPLRVYGFSTTSADTNLTLSVLSQTSGAGVLVSVFDEGAGKTLATSDSSFGGVTYRLPAIDRRYRVEVRAGSTPGDIAFSICFGACAGEVISPDSAQSGAPVGAPTATPTSIPPAAVCTVVSTAGGAVNIRSGPATVYLISGSLPVGIAATVIGQNGTGGNTWFQINLNGLVGWVSASVTRQDGDCSAVPFASAPTNAPLAPTAVPTQPPQNNPQPPQQSDDNNGDNGDNGNNDQPPSDALPDLEVTVTQLNRPNGNDTVAIGFSILNRGDASAPPAFIQICIDGSCNNTGFTRTLSPGESDTGFVTFTMPQKPLINGLAQFYNIVIQVNADKEFQEIAISNNIYQSQIQ